MIALAAVPEGGAGSSFGQTLSEIETRRSGLLSGERGRRGTSFREVSSGLSAQRWRFRSLSDLTLFGCVRRKCTRGANPE